MLLPVTRILAMYTRACLQSQLVSARVKESRSHTPIGLVQNSWLLLAILTSIFCWLC